MGSGGSNPSLPTTHWIVAQLVEHLAVNQDVARSNRAFPVKWKRPTTGGGAVLKTAGRKVWGFESLRFRYRGVGEWSKPPPC